VSGAPAPAPGSDPPAPLTERQPFIAPTIHEMPEPELVPIEDGWDMPTKSDPNLRKLVERELELHKKRKGSA
jgi:hypothetical protein